MAQTITNAMFRKPRFDFSSEYIVQCFRLECICLRQEANLVKNILDTQVCNKIDAIHKIAGFSLKNKSLGDHLREIADHLSFFRISFLH